MVMVQDGRWLSSPEKPLRITGEQSRCQVSSISIFPATLLGNEKEESF